MGVVSKAQIVWAETKDLRVTQGEDRAVLSALRRHIAAIATQAEKTFARFEPLPSYDDSLLAKDVADCAAAGGDAPPEALRHLRVIVWPSADGKTLSKRERKQPTPWDTAAAESLKLIGRFKVDGQDVVAFSRPVGANEDAPRFISLVTGTGLPPLVIIYLNLILESGDRIGGLTIAGALHDVAQVFANMPPAGSTFLPLLAVSHGTLLSGKLLGAYRGAGNSTEVWGQLTLQGNAKIATKQ